MLTKTLKYFKVIVLAELQAQLGVTDEGLVVLEVLSTGQGEIFMDTNKVSDNLYIQANTTMPAGHHIKGHQNSVSVWLCCVCSSARSVTLGPFQIER